MKGLAGLLLVVATGTSAADAAGAAAPAGGDAAAAAPALAAAAAPPAPLPAIVLAGGLPPAWRGIPADEAGGTQGASMMYPAPNAAGLLAAILTHAVIVSGTREGARKARQDEADKVLLPHLGSIGRLTAERVAHAAAALLAARPAAQAATGRVLEVRPSFALAPDQRVLVLDSAVKITAAGSTAAPQFEGIVRVVSTPRLEAEPQAAWTAEDGRLLEQESVAMLAHSLELALSVANRPADPASARTQRYAHGAAEKMERGELLASGCGRVVLRNLRDWLMSVPVGATTPVTTTPVAAAPGATPPETAAPAACAETYTLAAPAR
jgi:hypothetical protein